ncbi:MAG: Hsp20/alpha crystallin family protein [Candidatus Thorarchaeota archaeon]
MSFTLIDDDFEKIFRQVIERFFGGSIDTDGEGSVRFGFGQIPQGHRQSDVEFQESSISPTVEKVEQGNGLLVIVRDLSKFETPKARIEKGRLVIEAIEEQKELSFEIPFAVDVERSSYSFRNGVIEVELSRANEDEDAQVRSSGFLKIV